VCHGALFCKFSSVDMHINNDCIAVRDHWNLQGDHVKSRQCQYYITKVWFNVNHQQMTWESDIFRDSIGEKISDEMCTVAYQPLAHIATRVSSSNGCTI